jgi:HTH-type transcriptional regulator / antitoxin HigA
MGTDYRTPAQLIEAHLQARGWTQRVLALVLGTDENTVSKIMNGAKPINAEMALTLQAVLEIPADQLMQLQKEYELAKAKIEVRIDPGLPTRATLFGELPITEMIKRGWLDGITDTRDVAKLEAALCKFFGVDSVEQIEILPHAAKKTNVSMPATPAQIAWLNRVKQIAEDMLVAKYSESALRDGLQKLSLLLGGPEQVRKVPRIMMECGIRFVIVESLPSAKIDGVCFWLDDKSPVIGMTLRYDRIDNFWFVLRHECEHVLRQHGRSAAMLDINLEGERAGTGANVPEDECIANEAAQNFCVPQSALDRFIARKAPFFAQRDILGFASTVKVHPGLVAGQLQHHTGRYDKFRNHLVKIRSAILPNAIVDGWGNVAPIGE